MKTKLISKTVGKGEFDGKTAEEEARALRLKAAKLKSSIATIHKSQKGYALAFGKYLKSIRL